MASEDHLEAAALYPVDAFLHRVFPADHYAGKKSEIISSRVFQPRKDTPAFSLITPIDWEANGRREDRNWRMQLQGWTVFHPIINFYDSYHDKSSINQFFLEVVRDWWIHYGSDRDDVTTSRMPDSYAWYDMSVGFRALVLAFFLNRISVYFPDFSKEDLLFLRKVADKHVANLANPETFSLNNHGLFQAQGLMALAQTAPHQDKDVLSLASKRIEDLVASQFDQRGIHLEHSPHYHFYAANVISNVLSSGWYDNSDFILDRMNKIQHAKYWLVDPLRRPACVGDSILTAQRELSPSGPLLTTEGDFVSSDFNESGYAVVRSNWLKPVAESSMIFATAMFHSTTHKHRDCLSFEWFDAGRKIICDSGKYGYRSDKYRNYFLSARAHNSIEIEGFDVIKMKPYGSGIRSIAELEDDVHLIKSGYEYTAIKHNRNLYFKPGKWVILDDHLDFARAREFTQWLHLSTEFGVQSVREGEVLAKSELDGTVVSIDCLTPDLKTHIHFGNDIDVNGFLSEKDYEIKSALAVGFKGHGKLVNVVTAISLDAAARQDAFSYLEDRLNRRSPPGRNERASLQKSAGEKLERAPVSPKVGPGPTSSPTTSRNVDGTEFTFVTSRKESDRLLVLLPGATNREKGHIDCQRHSWASDFPVNVISVSDPTITQTNTLSIGWFQGTEREYAIERLEILIRTTAAELGIAPQNVSFFGSSAGGFVALKMAERFTDSISVAINPQIYLKNYEIAHYQRMIDYSYGGASSRAVERQHGDRLSVSGRLSERNTPVFIFQNTYDLKHMRNHLGKYISSIPQDAASIRDSGADAPAVRAVNVEYYSDEQSRHSPPGRKQTVEFIMNSLANSDRR